MHRILVIGSGGSGKTTLARALAARTGLPVIHLDQLFWHPGWIATPNDEWDRRVGELVARDAWIMDGNYGRTLPMRLAAADTVVFLDMSRLVCTWRILKRRLLHIGRGRPDVAPGCPEQLSWEFIQWVWTYPSRRRAGILRSLEAVRREKQVLILKNTSEVIDFLERVR